MKKKRPIFIILIFIIGFAVFMYPIVSNIYNSIFQTKVIDEYRKEVDSRSDEEKQKMLDDMKDYNNSVAHGLVTEVDPFAKPEDVHEAGAGIYIDSMDEKHGKMIGILKIPSVNINTPIFNGVSESQLQRGVGVLPGTSLPVGGEGTHSVITGHRGLPTARLFTDLPSVKMGDTFTIEVLDQKITYEVRKIKTIAPTQVDDLQIIPGEDVVTLFTCTPYMVNSHRLIITGFRIEDAIEDAASGMDCCCKIIITIIICTLIIAIILLLIYRRLGRINANLKNVFDDVDKIGKNNEDKDQLENKETAEIDETNVTNEVKEEIK